MRKQTAKRLLGDMRITEAKTCESLQKHFDYKEESIEMNDLKE